jgi:hypothetical protein
LQQHLRLSLQEFPQYCPPEAGDFGRVTVFKTADERLADTIPIFLHPREINQ